MSSRQDPENPDNGAGITRTHSPFHAHVSHVAIAVCVPRAGLEIPPAVAELQRGEGPEDGVQGPHLQNNALRSESSTGGSGARTLSYHPFTPFTEKGEPER